LAGTVAVQQTLLCTLPGTASTFFGGEMHRAPDGGFILLSIGTGPGIRLHRIGLTRQGGIATEIPVNNQWIFGSQQIREVAVNDMGVIFLTGPGALPGVGSRIFRLDPDGGSPTIFRTSMRVDFASVEVAPSGALVGGGGALTFTPSPVNFECNISQFGGIPQALGPIGAFIPQIVDLHIDENGDTLMVVNVANTTTIERHGANCTAPANPVIAGLPTGVIGTKVTRDFVARSAEFGASAPWSATNIARCVEATVPTIGGVWGIGLNGGQPNAVFALSVGAAELPAPADLGPAGAPGSALYQSNDALGSGLCNANGNGVFSIPVPINPSLIGSAQFAQCAVLTTYNALGLSVTNAIHSIIQ
jgi:hypothetical protein